MNGQVKSSRGEGVMFDEPRLVDFVGALVKHADMIRSGGNIH